MEKLIIIAKVETVMFSTTVAWWYFLGVKTVTGFSDTLFVISTIAMSIGLIIALSNTSLRHLYKHLRAKDKGKEVNEVEFAKRHEKRKRLSSYGAMVSISGVLGMLITAVIAFNI